MPTVEKLAYWNKDKSERVELKGGIKGGKKQGKDKEKQKQKSESWGGILWVNWVFIEITMGVTNGLIKLSNTKIIIKYKAL